MDRLIDVVSVVLFISMGLNAKIRLSVKMVAKPVIYIKTNYLLQTNFAYKK